MSHSYGCRSGGTWDGTQKGPSATTAFRMYRATGCPVNSWGGANSARRDFVKRQIWDDS